MKIKYYHYDKDRNNIEKSVNEFMNIKRKTKEATFVYLFNENDLLDEEIEERVNHVIKYLKQNKISNFTVSFQHELSDKFTNKESLSKLIKLSEKLPDIHLGIEDSDTTWTIPEIMNANNQIDEIADEIKQKDLSPLEALMYAYFKCTNRRSKEANDDEPLSFSRTIYGVLNSDKIVCVGYCEILREIMHRLNYKNIELFQNNVACVIPNEEFSKHRTLITYIKDEKYNLDGYYYLDPTWDRNRTEHQEFRLNHFLIPLQEVQNIKEFWIESLPIAFDGIRYITDDDELTKIVNRPEKNVEISVYRDGAKVSEEFVKSLLKDESFVQKFIKSEGLLHNPYLMFEYLSNRSQALSLGTMKQAISVVIDNMYDDQKGGNEELRKKLVQKIISDNIKTNKVMFEDCSRTTFSDDFGRTYNSYSDDLLTK